MAKQYSQCPKCHSDNFEYGDYEFDSDIWQPVHCVSCGFEWLEVYSFFHNEKVLSGGKGVAVLDDNGEPIDNTIIILEPA